MPLYPIFFLLVFVMGTFLSLFRGPIYGLITYVFIYFNIPSHQWWGGYLPDLRWSFISASLLTLSVLLHREKLGKIQFGIKSPLTYLLLLLILMCLIAPFAYSPPLACQKIYGFFGYIYIYILIVLIITDEQKYRLFIYSLFCLYFYLAWQAHFHFNGGRLDGVGLPDASDANMLAALILLIIPFLIQHMLYGSRSEKLFSSLIFLPVANVFMMCGSRGGFLGLISMGLVLVFLQLKQLHFFKILIVACSITAAFLGLMDDKFKDRLLGLKGSIQTFKLEENSAGRIPIWNESLAIIKDYPFGTGGGGLMELSPYYFSNELIEKTTGKRASHNTYLLLLIEQGVIGLFLYILFILSIFNNLLFNKKESTLNNQSIEGCKYIKSQGHAIASSICGFLIASLFIDRLYFELIYIIYALSSSVVFIKNNDF